MGTNGKMKNGEIVEFLTLLYDVRDNLKKIDVTESNELMCINDDINKMFKFEGTLMDMLYPTKEGDENYESD